MGATHFVLVLALIPSILCQTKDIRLPGTDSNSPDTKIFSSGNAAIDGGIIGLGLGALGAAVLGPALTNQAASAPQTGCGRRKRQADGEERFFLPGEGSCTCGRRKRQAGDNNVQPDTKFFGLFGNNNQHCGSCCYNQGFSAGSSQGGFSQGSTGGCQCDYSKTFTDQYGNIHGACRRADNSGARGATQLGGVTQDVETYSLQAGSQATPGPTEHAPLVVDLDKRRNNKNNNNNMIN